MDVSCWRCLRPFYADGKELSLHSTLEAQHLDEVLHGVQELSQQYALHEPGFKHFGSACRSVLFDRPSSLEGQPLLSNGVVNTGTRCE